MIDLALAVIFLVAPVVTWWWSRSATYTAVSLILGFGIAGNLVQSTIAWGAAWQVRSLQLLAVGVMAVVLVMGHLVRVRTSAEPLGRQVVAVGVPIAVFGVFLVAMRVLAPEDPGALTGLGYLMNHPMGEDNAKFLHLAAQLADGREISFNGYAAGPLLLVMSVIAAVMSVLSMILLGGVNEVAVVLNTVIGSQHLFMILAPFAFAPLADRLRSRGTASTTPAVPLPTIWLGALVLFLANAVLTEYGHVSLQFVLIILVLWAVSFLGAMPWWISGGMTLAIATSASVWLPLNVLGLTLCAALIVWCALRRLWWGLGLTLITLIVSWDALFTSILFLLGIDGADDAGGGAGAGSDIVGQGSQLFDIPGGTEQTGAVLGILALAALIAAAVTVHRSPMGRTIWTAFAPIVVFSVYVVAITVGDAIASGASPNYGALKITFALTVMIFAACLPIALVALDPDASAMTPLRWIISLGVLVLLMIDTLLPRGLNAISPVRWGGIDDGSPIFWAAAEVKPTPNQPLSSLPVACVIAPPVSDTPTALPWGQETYACTRLLVGMNGLEGQTGTLVQWLGTEWSQQRSLWNEQYREIEGSVAPFATRPVIMVGTNAELVGLTTFADLLAKNPPQP